MRNVWPIALLVVLAGCYYFANVQKEFREYKPEIVTSINAANKSTKWRQLVLVFSEKDSAKYNLPVTTLLKIDTTRDDLDIYWNLAREYVVVKLYRKELEAILADSARYGHLETVKADAAELDAGRSYYFLSTRNRFNIYAVGPLDDPKAEIHDLILVGFGP